MIEFKNLNKVFNNSLKVLDNLSLNVETGNTVVIIGRSGCGKSVLLKHLIGILKPDSGQVIVDGQDITLLDEAGMNKVRARVGMVFQGGALFDSLTVGENVGFRMIEHDRKIGRKELLERVEEALSLVDLHGIGSLMPSELSGGMRKRVALARAICAKPEIILYDEPTTGLDPITSDSINDLIVSMHDKLKVTSIVVTHDMKSAYKIADKIAMMYKGKIIAEGKADEIEHSRNQIVHQFVNGLAQGPITETIEQCRPGDICIA